MRRHPFAKALVVVMMLLATSPRVQAEVITPPNAKFDAGAVHVGDTIEHTFRIKNTFGLPYTIWRLKASCACVAKEGERKTAQPGEEIEIKIRVNEQAAGRKTQTIYVVPVGESLPTLRCTVTANVRRRLRITPDRLTGKLAASDSKRVRVTNLDLQIMGDADPPRIAHVAAMPAVLDCKLIPNPEDPKRYTITVLPRPGLPAGRHVGRIQVFGAPKPKSHERPVLGEVPFDVTLERGPLIHPAHLAFSILRMSTRPRLKRYLIIELANGEQFVSAESRTDFVRIQEVSGAGDRVVLSVSLDAGRLPRGPMRTNLTVKYREKMGAAIRQVTIEVTGHVVD